MLKGQSARGWEGAGPAAWWHSIGDIVISANQRRRLLILRQEAWASSLAAETAEWRCHLASVQDRPTAQFRDSGFLSSGPPDFLTDSPNRAHLSRRRS